MPGADSSADGRGRQGPVSGRDSLWGGASRSGRPTGSHPAAATTTAGPVELEHLHAVAGRVGHGRAEVGPAIHRDPAEHPHRRAGNDLAGEVEALDLKAHVLRVPRTRVVDVTLDRRPLPSPRRLPLEAEVALDALGGIDLR